VATMSPGPIFSTKGQAALDIAFDNTGVLVSWPWNSAGLLLEQSYGLPTTNWGTQSVTPLLNDWRNQVRFFPSEHQAFYRLRLP
jgi:hypothetical protein